MKQINQTMRDVFIDGLYQRMGRDERIFFLAADFGSPQLDRLRQDFSDRFINVGIAEQNLVNVASGLALEGYAVYGYAIAPFLTMRAYEQIRNNLSLLSKAREVNVNLIGVGAGLSYDVSGPTHHCLEDLSIMRALPNLTVFSPSDWKLTEAFLDHSLNVKKPKYLRFDGKPLPAIYEQVPDSLLKTGFCELKPGKEVCLVSTGYMTHGALAAAQELKTQGIEAGVVDVFMLKPLDEEALSQTLKKYDRLLTLEEAFIGKGGLDGLIASLLNRRGLKPRVKSMGFEDEYVFEMGGRAYLHKKLGLEKEHIMEKVRNLMGERS